MKLRQRNYFLCVLRNIKKNPTFDPVSRAFLMAVLAASENRVTSSYSLVQFPEISKQALIKCDLMVPDESGSDQYLTKKPDKSSEFYLFLSMLH